jgi:hypothetical protein
MGNTQVKVKTVYYQKTPFAQVISQAKPGPFYEFDLENTLPTMYVYKSSKPEHITKIFCPTMSFHDSIIFIKSTLRGLELGKQMKSHRRRKHRHHRRK